MQTTKFFCDICAIEFPPKEYCFINGQVTKMDAQYKPVPFAFVGHYCGECTELILEYVAKLKNGHNKDKKK